MTVQLPIPIKTISNDLIRSIEIREVTAGVISETKRVANNGNPYRAYQSFIAGCTVSLQDITDRPGIYGILGYLPYKDAEEIVRRILTLDGTSDKIEGVYSCPLCGTHFNAVGDNADHALELEVIMGENEEISLVLNRPVEIPADELEPIKEASVLTFMHPTLNQCSNAFGKYGDKNEAKLQLGIYEQVLIKVNNTVIDQKWKNRWAMFVLSELNRVDTAVLTREMNKLGLKTEVERTCKECENKWTEGINTINFFVSALR